MADFRHLIIMDYKFVHLNQTHTVSIEKSGGRFKATIRGKHYEIENIIIQSNNLSFMLNKKVYTIYFAQDKGKLYLAVDGDYFSLDREKSVDARTKESILQKGDSVSSPMPGLVVKIPIAVGDSIKSGTTLAIVEAMKMQNELRAPRDGIVKKINFKEGDQVDALQPIVELET